MSYSHNDGINSMTRLRRASDRFGLKIQRLTGNRPLPRIARVQVRLDMPLDHPLIRHPAMEQLLQNRGFARHRPPARPFTICPQPENPPGGKGQIDQLGPELVPGLEVSNRLRDNVLWGGACSLRFGQNAEREKEIKTDRAREKSSTMRLITSNSR